MSRKGPPNVTKSDLADERKAANEMTCIGRRVFQGSRRHRKMIMR
jgi:hypothetical protein